MRTARGVATVLTVCILLAAMALAQEAPANLVKNGDMETGMENWVGGVKPSADSPHGGASCLMADKRGSAFSKELIPIDTAKTYILTGWFRSTGEKDCTFYLGYAPFDENKKPVACNSINALRGTETTLAEACTKADKVLKVTDTSKWVPKNAADLRKAGKPINVHACIAFEVNDTGAYADLPNKNLSKGYGIVDAVKTGEQWEVTLKNSVNRAYPAGTKIRLHRAGSAYIYNASGNRPAPKQWKQFKGKISGTAQYGATSAKWWPGTKYAKILLLTHYNNVKGGKLYINDIEMKEAP